MGYVAGEKILDDEYNTFVNSSSSPFGYNHFAGTGSGEYGLGQTHIATVDAGQNITASQWNTLFTAMDTIANHTNDTLTTRSQVSAGDTIAIKAAVEADLATLAASVAAGCPNATALTTSGILQQPASSSTWTGSFTTQVSATFADANTMRFFFNAGGKIRIDPIRTGNGGSDGASGKDGAWDNLYNAVGNLDIGSVTSTRSGSGETLTTDGFAIGFQDVTTSYQTVFLLTQANGTYTSMTLKGEIKGNATQGSTTNVTIKMTLTDADGGDILYTSGNLSSVDQYENFIGQTDFATKLMLPTTAQGLNPVYTLSGSAETSNTTA